MLRYLTKGWDIMHDMAGRLVSYLDKVRRAVGNTPRMKSLSTYCAGLLSSEKRKTVESIAAAASAKPMECDALYQRVLHTVGQAAWDDAKVRYVAETYVIDAMTAREQISQWIIDDTGLIKQGSHSVGVKRQYTGTAGKVTNCQVTTSLVVSTASTQAPVDLRIYLPKEWTDSLQRRAEAKIPDHVVFQTKPELALDLVVSALNRGTPRGRVCADSAYGDSSAFRAGLRERNLDMAVGIKAATSAWSVDGNGRRRGPKTSVEAIARRLEYRRITWRHGTKGAMTSSFGARRIVTCREYVDHGLVEPVWLLVERPERKGSDAKYALLTDGPNVQVANLAHQWKERYRTERAYQDAKQNVGFDDYQGRSFLGWHHHATAVVVCCAFLVAEQCRLYSPRPKGPRQAIRTTERLQRHYPDSFPTMQVIASRIVDDWAKNTFGDDAVPAN